MAIHGDGDGDKGSSILEDSAARDRQADGYPYIVFGYGSLIFRVRFPELCLRPSPSQAGLNERLNPSYFLAD